LPAAESSRDWRTRLPFYYGWIVVGVAFVTMGIGVNARTSFSLLYPAILDEFGWDRGATAGIFAFGFAASMGLTPFVGLAMERFGPQRVIPVGALFVALGLLLATQATTLWMFYVTFGAMTVGGSVCLSYIGHATFLPNWFVRRRGMMIAIAFSGVGVGGIVLLPALQLFIGAVGWREACIGMAILVLVVIVPINALLQRHRPEDLQLQPDGEQAGGASTSAVKRAAEIADPAFAAIEWTYRRIAREPRFWALSGALFCSLFVHYAVLVHQTKFFIEVGFGVTQSAWALGFVGLVGIPGQLFIGALSDRIGREWGWALAMSGYVIAFSLFLAMLEVGASPALLYASILAVGALGAGTGPLFGSIGAELFGGRYYGRVFGLLGVATALGAATGAWATGWVYDITGGYALGFKLGLVFTVLSAIGVAYAGPGSVRPVTGRRAG
jgi:sugar phosphate permease